MVVKIEKMCPICAEEDGKEGRVGLELCEKHRKKWLEIPVANKRKNSRNLVRKGEMNGNKGNINLSKMF